MLAFAAASFLVCALSALMAFGLLGGVPPAGQNVALLVSAVAALVLLGAFEAHEAEGPSQTDTDDWSGSL